MTGMNCYNEFSNVMIWVVIFPAFFYNKKARKGTCPECAGKQKVRRRNEGIQHEYITHRAVHQMGGR